MDGLSLFTFLHFRLECKHVIEMLIVIATKKITKRFAGTTKVGGSSDSKEDSKGR